MATKYEIGSTPIRIKNTTVESIKKIGLMGETYDDVISRLVKLYNGNTIGDKGKTPEYTTKV